MVTGAGTVRESDTGGLGLGRDDEQKKGWITTSLSFSNFELFPKMKTVRKVRVQTLRIFKNRKVCTRISHVVLVFGNFILKTK